MRSLSCQEPTNSILLHDGLQAGPDRCLLGRTVLENVLGSLPQESTLRTQLANATQRRSDDRYYQKLATRILGYDIDELDTSSEPLVIDLDVLDVLKMGNESQEPNRREVQTFSIDFLIALTSSGPFVVRAAASELSTMNAIGTSPQYSSGIPTTPTSATSGWSRRCPSSSAGATWYPRHLMSS